MLSLTCRYLSLPPEDLGGGDQVVLAAAGISPPRAGYPARSCRCPTRRDLSRSGPIGTPSLGSSPQPQGSFPLRVDVEFPVRVVPAAAGISPTLSTGRRPARSGPRSYSDLSDGCASRRDFKRSSSQGSFYDFRARRWWIGARPRMFRNYSFWGAVCSRCCGLPCTRRDHSGPSTTTAWHPTSSQYLRGSFSVLELGQCLGAKSSRTRTCSRRDTSHQRYTTPEILELSLNRRDLSDIRMSAELFSVSSSQPQGSVLVPHAESCYR